LATSTDRDHCLCIVSDQEKPVTLSQRYWNLDWTATCPWRFDDVVVEAAPFAAGIPFMREHYPSIFETHGEQSRFLSSPMTAAKRRFCDEADTFVFRSADRTIGLFIGNPSDWSTYYLRSTAILPAYRERRLFTRFVEQLYAPLRAVGVERVEAECSPANTPIMRVLIGQGFFVTSTANSERWGATVRLTKFLADEAAQVFLRQFNCVTRTKKEVVVAPHPERSLS
jgi:hypothetical protein